MRPRLLAAGACLLVLGACTSPVEVDAYPTEPGSDVTCTALLADLPPTVADLERQQVRDEVAAAWGDPPVVLRCGVGRPEALTAASQCNEVAGVGWFSETTADGRLFTTIGRAAYVSVDVPAEHTPAADVLVDLAEAVDKHVPVEQPCV